MMDKKTNYHHQRDDYLFYVKGFSEFADTNKDAMKFAIELRTVHDQFYMDDKEIESHFIIRHRGTVISKVLNDYFIGHNSYYYNDRLYGNQLNLLDMFGTSLEYSAIFGDIFYYIDWEAKKINKSEYILPTSFDYIPPETMKIHKKKNKVQQYEQRYSVYEKAKQKIKKKQSFSDYGINTIKFEPWKIFHVTYPIGSAPPVQTLIRSLRSLLSFWNFTLSSGEASTHQKPRSLAVERSRSKSFNEERRKYNLLKTKSQRAFALPLAVDDVSLTRYYDFFSVARYKAEQYIARKYYVDVFNEQILKPFAEKNGIKQPPVLEMISLITDTEAYEAFHKWEDLGMTDEEFIERVARAK